MFQPTSFPRSAILMLIVLASISTIATLFFIMPLQLSLWISGYNEALFQKLIHISKYFQIIPSFLQILISFWLLNRYLSHVRFVSRWIFILFFTLTLINTNYDSSVAFASDVWRLELLRVGTKRQMRYTSPSMTRIGGRRIGLVRSGLLKIANERLFKRLCSAF